MRLAADTPLTDVTLGEVFRGLQETKLAVSGLAENVVATRVAVEVQRPKISRLESIVYGTLMLAAAAFLTAATALIVNLVFQK